MCPHPQRSSRSDPAAQGAGCPGAGASERNSGHSRGQISNVRWRLEKSRSDPNDHGAGRPSDQGRGRVAWGQISNFLCTGLVSPSPSEVRDLTPRLRGPLSWRAGVKRAKLRTLEGQISNLRGRLENRDLTPTIGAVGTGAGLIREVEKERRRFRDRLHRTVSADAGDSRQLQAFQRLRVGSRVATFGRVTRPS